MPTVPAASRRDFLRTLGVSAAALPFVANLPSLAFANQGKPQAAARRGLQPQRHHALHLLAEGVRR